MALLDELKKVHKRLGMNENHLPSNEGLLAYVDVQITEMQQILTRMRVDILLNEQIPVEGQSETDGSDQKIKELQRDAKQMVEAVNVLVKLRDELQAS